MPGVEISLRGLGGCALLRGWICKKALWVVVTYDSWRQFPGVGDNCWCVSIGDNQWSVNRV